MVKRLIPSLVTALCAVAGAALGLSASSAMQGSRNSQIRQPDYWIPMTIDCQVGNEDGVTYLLSPRIQAL